MFAIVNDTEYCFDLEALYYTISNYENNINIKFCRWNDDSTKPIVLKEVFVE